LQRPLYYLDCERFGTHVVWNEERADFLEKDEMVRPRHQSHHR
jgi:hypothetical protein